MTRRRTFTDNSVSYAAVGATQAADVLVFPPAGFSAAQAEHRIGSSEQRFETAADLLLSWGMQRGSHLALLSVEEAADLGYVGLTYDATGNVISRDAAAHEVQYSADGTPYVSSGAVVEIRGVWPLHKKPQSYRVIYVIREQRRVGFALGTMSDTPVSGEEFFGVEWREDDGVWTVVRSVTAIAPTRPYKLLTPAIRLWQWYRRRHYARVLAPVRAS